MDQQHKITSSWRVTKDCTKQQWCTFVFRRQWVIKQHSWISTIVINLKKNMNSNHMFTRRNTRCFKCVQNVLSCRDAIRTSICVFKFDDEIQFLFLVARMFYRVRTDVRSQHELCTFEHRHVIAFRFLWFVPTSHSVSNSIDTIHFDLESVFVAEWFTQIQINRVVFQKLQDRFQYVFGTNDV